MLYLGIDQHARQITISQIRDALRGAAVAFAQDDAHVFCREDQIEDEILAILDLNLSMLADFGFDQFEGDVVILIAGQARTQRFNFHWEGK